MEGPWRRVEDGGLEGLEYLDRAGRAGARLSGYDGGRRDGHPL